MINEFKELFLMKSYFFFFNLQSKYKVTMDIKLDQKEIFHKIYEYL